MDRVLKKEGIRRVIDIGGGVGTWAFRVARRHLHVSITSFDLAEGQVKNAQDLLEGPFSDLKDRVNFYQGDAEDMRRESDGSYDLAICLHDVLNHIPHYEATVKEMARVANRHITSVHTAEGPRTFYTVSPDEVDYSTVRKEGDWLRFSTKDRTDYVFHDKLFRYDEVTGLFRRHTEVIDSFGIDVGVSDNLRRLKGDSFEVLPRLRVEEDKIKRLDKYATKAEHILVYSRTVR
ncbi:hypothetical protein COV16_05220 [Candidatus Woesearchaeota archaeon CG10_big_fil_rev_8_21_14_0_10_34_8]|nr:MAG: hypothetical protein COV16_05220 [Candidatus Woesearchaeota archaeon CG10_big_fil_rev_8_21_14_0_10_34_8]